MDFFGLVVEGEAIGQGIVGIDTFTRVTATIVDRRRELIKTLAVLSAASERSYEGNGWLRYVYGNECFVRILHSVDSSVR